MRGDIVNNKEGCLTKCVDYQGGGVGKKRLSVKHLFVDNRASWKTNKIRIIMRCVFS